MTSTTPRTSLRLRAGVDLYAAADGHLLRVGDSYHHVRLPSADVADLLDALADGGEPTSPQARAALEALVAAGLADVPPAHLWVDGDGRLAESLRAALTRMGARLAPDGSPVAALDDDRLPDDLPGPACWVAGHRVVLSPPAVRPVHVAARHLAATRHRGADPRTVPVPGGGGVTSAVPLLASAGLELAAVQVAAELLRPDRPAHEAVAIDLRALTVTRHPVLPVPPAPR